MTRRAAGAESPRRPSTIVVSHPGDRKFLETVDTAVFVEAELFARDAQVECRSPA
jgi:hypothetical protein